MLGLKARGRLSLAVIVAVLLGGCGLGEKNILFVTKTTVGVDVDSKPPTLDIGFDRKEGTLAPVFDDGTVLPQMAGFSSQLGIINQAIGQSFATGNAAVLMSKYLTSTAQPKLVSEIQDSEVLDTDGAMSSVSTSGNRKRYFFATDTSFGFRVNFGLETGGIPDSLSLGYKRKELAFVPLMESQPGGEGTPVKIKLPSLLATSGLATDVSSPQAANVIKTQFFATGNAASYLAALPGIRAAVAPRIMPDAAKAITAARLKGRETGATRTQQISQIVKHVTPEGLYTKTLLVDLFNKTDIPDDDGERKFVEAATSSKNLTTRLDAADDVVEKLHAQLP